MRVRAILARVSQGTLIGQRFTILEEAASGGMGSVYRARDEHTGHVVALKLLRAPNDDAERHLVQEAQTLAELHHPGIVARIAHGNTDRGEPYLAMEWLDGVDLATRLKQGPLGLDDTLVLFRSLAETLAWAHARGIVHLDLKPANVMLVGGEPARPKILDFGLARVGALGTLPSGAPRIAGTPGYMAPEQARGEDDLDVRADVFALGVLVYRCLAGVPPFPGRDGVAILAKSIFEEPAPLLDVAPQVPASLGALVAKMMSKARSDRPKDGAALVSALDELLQRRAAAIKEPGAEQGRRERRLLAIVVCELPPASGPTPLRTWSANVSALRAAAARWEARFEVVGNGAAVALFVGSGTATELAVDAARCALSMSSAIPGASIAVACAHGDAGAPMGDMLERATVLLRREGARPGSIGVDDTTNALLPRRFSRATEGESITLRAEVTDDQVSGTLFGRATPFVGRGGSLARLLSTIERAIRAPASAGVQLVGDAGLGKSRLAVEALREVQHRFPHALFWRARGLPLCTTSPFGIIGQLLRSALGASSEPSRYTLEAFCRRTLPNHPEAPAFLAELLGLTPDDELVRSARRDVRVMGDRLRLAWTDLVAATCAARPLVLLIEDMHFADEASVTFLDAALRRTQTAPLFTLATSRPDGRTRTPSMYDTRAMAAWPMEALPAEAAVQLITAVLGAVPPGELDAFVERAGGNALYLEELLRAHRAGYGAESLMGLITARILTFPAEARRVLQAASVLGERFTTREVAALLGDDAEQVPTWLRDLEHREALRPLGEGRHGFRHGLVRDAAYARLTEEERVLDHRLAGQMLEPRGDPSLVAEHFERAGDRAEAIAKHDQAATIALARSDCAGALRHVRRAIESGAHGAELAHLQGVAAEAHNGRGAHTEAALASLAAMAGLPEGSAEFHRVLTEHIVAAARTGNVDRVLEMARRVLGLPSVAETAGLRAIALARAASSLLFGKHRAEGLRIVTEVEALLAAHPQDDLLVVALARELRGHRARALGDLVSPRALFEGAADAHELLGAERNAASCRVAAASSACKVGQWERAESLLRSALLTSERLGIDALAMTARSNLGLALLGQGCVDEGLAFERRAIDASVLAADTRLEGGARVVLAMLLLRTAQPQAAAEEALRAVDALSVDPVAQAVARAVLARAKTALGDASGALDAARKAMEAVRTEGTLADGEVLIRLAYAEALEGTGDTQTARLALTVASEKLLEHAQRIEDQELRRSFLERVPEHAETLARLRAKPPT